MTLNFEAKVQAPDNPTKKLCQNGIKKIKRSCIPTKPSLCQYAHNASLIVFVERKITPERSFAHWVALTYDMSVDPAFASVLSALFVVVGYKLFDDFGSFFDILIHFLPFSHNF